MEEHYRLPCWEETGRAESTAASTSWFEKAKTEISGSEMADLLKTQISSHPFYPNLVSAYIECQKVGAPPEMASLLEELSRVKHSFPTQIEIGADPELDEFMESYCEILQRLKEELSRPLVEATTFLSNIESQLSSLCRGALVTNSFQNDQTHSDEANAGTLEEDMSCNEVCASKSTESSSALLDKDLKELLLRKYGGYLTNLRKEFSKKRKKGKLPKDARMTLLAWWHSHYRWPYPTEDEKAKLSELTGLDQKQINNWFINQRKRHWKPTEDMRFAVMEDVGGSIDGSMFFDT